MNRAMERRTLLKLVAAGVLPASNGLVQIACSTSGYQPEFFSRGQLSLLEILAELIIPADEHSPGARAAGVARYMDVLAADAPAADQTRWSSGLEALAAMSRERLGKGFEECDASQQDSILAELASAEDSPSSAAEQFFVLLKQATIEGYYTSRVGIHEELRYMGNTAIDEFQGCTHEHPA